VDQLFSARPGSVAVSLRVAPDLPGRVNRQAERAGVPYQTFMKLILEAAVSRLHRRRELTGRFVKASPRR
jgi:predicted DNA binding CopG/RHH family protein